LIGSTDTSIEIARTARRLLVIEEKGMSQDIEPQVKPEPENPRRLAQIESPTTVREIMTADVVTVTPHQSLADAMALMATHRFHHLLVTNADGKLLGVLSDRDLLSALPGKPDWENYEVRQMMTKNPLAASPDDSLADARQQPAGHRRRRKGARHCHLNGSFASPSTYGPVDAKKTAPCWVYRIFLINSPAGSSCVTQEPSCRSIAAVTCGVWD
jgi:hypothetical protein